VPALDLSPVSKKKYIVFNPLFLDIRLFANCFQQLKLAGNNLKFVTQFKCMDHITDNRWEIKNLFTRTSLSIRFSRCSVAVKIKLFTGYCCVFMIYSYGYIIVHNT